MNSPRTDEPEGFTVGEIAARAGVTPRTIHYYVAQGLLPGPGKRGPRTRYPQSFLDLLLRARLLQLERNLSLRDIRRIFETEGLIQPGRRRRSASPKQDPLSGRKGTVSEAIQAAEPDRGWESQADPLSEARPEIVAAPAGPAASDLLAGLKALVGERSVPSAGSGDRWVTVPVTRDLVLAGRRLGRDEIQALQRAADYLRVILLSAGP